MECFIYNEEFTVIDDKGVGLNVGYFQSAITFLKFLHDKGELTTKEIISILSGIGISGVVLTLVMLAISDPEPTSKLGLLVGVGITLLLTGSFTIVYSLFNTSFEIVIKHRNSEYNKT